jgi:hypothetical protein
MGWDHFHLILCGIEEGQPLLDCPHLILWRAFQDSKLIGIEDVPASFFFEDGSIVIKMSYEP